MQLIKAEVTPIELKLRQPVRFAGIPEVTQVTAIFVRLELKDGRCAWGCGVAHPDLTGEKPDAALHACRKCADIIPDLNPLNLEFSLERLVPLANSSPAASCAYELAFHDLQGLILDMPLYRLLGGFRNRIQTSATVSVAPLQESVEMAETLAQYGFRMLKIKGGVDAEADVQRIQSIHHKLPHHVLRLDADGGYTIQEAIDVARTLKDQIEMLEQPTPMDDLEGLRQVTRNSPVPVLADQSLKGPASALSLAADHSVHGVSVKIATCGGLRCARQVDHIARAAQLSLMVSCVVEPALLTAAGLSFALSSPNVRYGDLDGYLGLINDPTSIGFRLEDGWLVASEIPGLGCTVEV